MISSTACICILVSLCWVVIVSADQICMDQAYGCVIDSKQKLRCFGVGAPVLYPRTGSYSHVACGSKTMCAIDTANNAICEGENEAGEAEIPPGQYLDISLGSAFTSYPQPVASYACGIRIDHTLVCWGNPIVPSMLMPPTGQFISVQASSNFVCALTIGLDIVCFGQLTQIGNFWPTIGPYVQIAVGKEDFLCALRPDATMRCWGVQSELTGRFTAIASRSGSLLCGIKPDLRVICKGPQIAGEGNAPADQLTQIAIGTFQSCGVNITGGLVCWTGTSIMHDYPQNVPIRQIASGSEVFCVLKTDTRAQCWDYRTYGVGVPNFPSTAVGYYRSLHGGGTSMCGVRNSDSSVYCYYNFDQTLSVPALSGDFTSAVIAGDARVCALDRVTKRPSCRGVCDNSFSGCSVPTTTAFIQIAASTRRFCGIGTNFQLTCTGACQAYGDCPPAGAYNSIAGDEYSVCAITRPQGRIVCAGSINIWDRTLAGQFVEACTSEYYICGVRAVDGQIQCIGAAGYNFNPVPLPTFPAGTYAGISCAVKFQRTGMCAIFNNTRTVVCGGDNDNGELNTPAGVAFAQVCGGNDWWAGLEMGTGAFYRWGRVRPDGISWSTLSGSYTLLRCSGYSLCVITAAGMTTCVVFAIDVYNLPVPLADVGIVTDLRAVACGIRKSDSELQCFQLDAIAWPPVKLPTGPFAVLACSDMCCAVRMDGTLACFGPQGQELRHPPNGTFRDVRCSSLVCCALTSLLGEVICFKPGSARTNWDVPEDDGYVQVFSSAGLYCALKNDSTATCWGQGHFGTAPGKYSTLAIQGGGSAVCGIRNDSSSTVYCWRSEEPQLGGLAPIGFYKRGTQLLPCRSGTYSLAPGATNDLCSGPCSPGSYANTYAPTLGCPLCPAGTTCPDYGMPAPIPCPAGRFNSGVGFSKECLECPRGFWCGLQTASLEGHLCPAGRYGNSTGLMSQLCDGPCPIGYACDAGTTNPYTNPCRPGTFASTPGSSACVRCPAGRFQPATAATFCEVCAAGKASATLGRDSDCPACDSGAYSPADSGSCTPCPVGTHAVRNGSQSGSACFACDVGYFSSAPSQATCLPCQAGRFANTVQSSFCQLCSAGFYQQDQGSSYCSSCPPGRITGAAGLPVCLDCVAGSLW